MNPLYKIFGKNDPNFRNGAYYANAGGNENGNININEFMNSRFMNFIQKFNHFRSTFQGDPKAQVEDLLASGQMSQEQFNHFSNLAAQMRGLFH